MKDLFIKIDDAYKKSDIRLKSEKNSWFYSLCTSKPKIGQPLIVGFNWGVSSNHRKQIYADLESVIDWNQMSSLQKTKPFIEKYFPRIRPDSFNQTNYCFFRSKKENEISDFDINLCEPIFYEFISRVKPRFILAFSKKLRETLMKNGMIKYLNKKSVFDGKKTITAYHGLVNFGGWWSYIYLLPHPSYWNRINNREEVLDQLWKICINTYPYEIYLTDFLNYLVSIGKTPILSEEPLNEKNMQSEVFNHDVKKISISNISAMQDYHKLLQSIDSFDLFDITAVIRLSFKGFESKGFKQYLIDKKKGGNQEKIINKNFEKKTFEWSYHIARIGLQRLWIYKNYRNDYVEYKKLVRAKNSDSWEPIMIN